MPTYASRVLKSWTSASRGWILPLAWLCLFVCRVPAVLAHDLNGDEHLLKSAFIYNFVKFTNWPRETNTDLGGALTLCTTGNDELVGSLQRLDAQMVRGRQIRVRTLDPGEVGTACQVLYVAASEHDRFSRFIELTRAMPVLTISQIRGFADAGGIIQLYRARTRIRFKINLAVARDSGLNLSARLLDLAELVDDRVTP